MEGGIKWYKLDCMGQDEAGAEGLSCKSEIPHPNSERLEFVS